MTLHIKIDGARALDLLAARVKDHESFVYQPPEPRDDGFAKCVYQHGGCPSCLIGCALFDAGVPVEELLAMDNCGGTINTGIGEVELPEGLVITPKAMQIFVAAQTAQDFGNTWGVAFQRATHAAADFGPEES